MARSLGPFCFVLLFVLLNGKNTSAYLTEREETMMVNIFQKKLGMAVLLVVFLGVACMGCSTTATEQQQGQPVTGPPSEGKAEGAEVGRVYLDDVRVPSELNYDADESILYETAKFKAGVLRFSKWRLDVQSVIDFFMFNMVKDKWTFVNAFKGKEVQLSFSKPDKTCTIRITETWTGMVNVAIAVGPLGEKKM
jgi:hypothetical protein